MNPYLSRLIRFAYLLGHVLVLLHSHNPMEQVGHALVAAMALFEAFAEGTPRSGKRTGDRGQ